MSYSIYQFRNLSDYEKSQKVCKLDKSLTPYDIISCFSGDYYKQGAFEELIDRINSVPTLISILPLMSDYYRNECISKFAKKWRIYSRDILSIMNTLGGDYYKQEALNSLLKTCIFDSLDIYQILKGFGGAYYQSESLGNLLKLHEKSYGNLTFDLIKKILLLFNQSQNSDYETYKLGAFQLLWNYNRKAGASLILQKPHESLALFNWRTAPYAYDMMESSLVKTTDEFTKIKSFIRECEEKTYNHKLSNPDSSSSSSTDASNILSKIFSGGNIYAGGCSVVINGNKTIINGQSVDTTPQRTFKFFSPAPVTPQLPSPPKKRTIKGLPTLEQSKNEYQQDVEEIEQNPNQDKCLVCSSAKRSYVSLPCGHPILCAKCVYEHCHDKTSSKCVLCSERIKSVARMREC